jgi:hypothetical protein
VKTFCAKLATAAFRRPLTEVERQQTVERYFREPTKLDESVKRVVLRILKSPPFLYPGLGMAGSDAHSVSARLALGLWDSLPDRELLRAADSGKLVTREEIVNQAARMLADPRARSKMRTFLHHWLQVDHTDDLSKDAALFPGFTGELISDLRTSLNLFLDDVVWGEGSDYRQLLLSESLFVNATLAGYYGIASEAADDFVKVPAGNGTRSGVLTHPYLLAAFSYQRSTSPIHRGVFLTRNIVGRALKPPPMAVAFKDADFAPNLTMREKVVELTRSEACQSCHSVINPLGFSLEQFDAVGRFRTEEKERPIDTVSDFVTDEGRTIRLAGARDVAEYALTSASARTGFIEQLFHSVVKQPVLAYGPETMGRLQQSFEASGFNLRQLLVEIATIAALPVLPGKSSSRNSP